MWSYNHCVKLYSKRFVCKVCKVLECSEVVRYCRDSIAICNTCLAGFLGSNWKSVSLWNAFWMLLSLKNMFCPEKTSIFQCDFTRTPPRMYSLLPGTRPVCSDCFLADSCLTYLADLDAMSHSWSADSRVDVPFPSMQCTFSLGSDGYIVTRIDCISVRSPQEFIILYEK